MLAFLSALRAFFAALSSIFGYARDKRLMDAGADEADAKSLAEAQDAAGRAARARDAVRDDPDSVRMDPFNRDTKQP